MPQFRVVYGDKDPSRFGTETFEAQDLNDALFFIGYRFSREPVELWRDGEFLGKLEHVVKPGGSFWRVA